MHIVTNILSHLAFVSSNGGTPWWLVLVAPVAALFGVALSQLITLANERGKRLSAHVSEARGSAEELMSGIYTFVIEVRASRSVQKHDQNGVYEDLWADASAELTKKAALLTGRQGHREAVEKLFVGLNQARGLAREGLGVGENVRQDYSLMSYAAYNAVAAWIRREGVPRSSRRLARKLTRSLYWYDLEWRAREHMETTGNEHTSGVLRRAWRWTIRRLRKMIRRLLSPLRAGWDFLFQP